MSGLSINASDLTNLLSNMYSLSNAQSSTLATSGDTSTTAAASTSSTSSTTQATNVGISKFAKLYQQLQTLQQQNPTKYKQVVTQIANQLNQAASQSSGTDQKFLSNLASTFQKAEDGSNLALPQPPGSGNSSGALAAYSAGQQTSSDQQALASLGQSGNVTGPNLSTSTKETLDSIFQTVDNAVSGLSS